MCFHVALNVLIKGKRLLHLFLGCVFCWGYIKVMFKNLLIISVQDFKFQVLAAWIAQFFWEWYFYFELVSLQSIVNFLLIFLKLTTLIFRRWAPFVANLFLYVLDGFLNLFALLIILLRLFLEHLCFLICLLKFALNICFLRYIHVLLLFKS